MCCKTCIVSFGRARRKGTYVKVFVIIILPSIIHPNWITSYKLYNEPVSFLFVNVVDYCSRDGCKNDGTCLNLKDGQKCTCPTGYIGDKCENGKYDCMISSFVFCVRSFYFVLNMEGHYVITLTISQYYQVYLRNFKCI